MYLYGYLLRIKQPSQNTPFYENYKILRFFFFLILGICIPKVEEKAVYVEIL